MRGAGPTFDGVWRDGDTVVLDRAARLPRRCVRCNAPAAVMLDRTLAWSPISPILRAMQSPLQSYALRRSYQRTARVDLGLCERHMVAHRWTAVAAWVFGAVSLALLVAAARALVSTVVEGGAPLAPGMVALVLGVAALAACTLCARRVWRPVAAARIDDRVVRIERVGRDFLESLPPLPPNIW